MKRNVTVRFRSVLLGSICLSTIAGIEPAEARTVVARAPEDCDVLVPSPAPISSWTVQASLDAVQDFNSDGKLIVCLASQSRVSFSSVDDSISLGRSNLYLKGVGSIAPTIEGRVSLTNLNYGGLINLQLALTQGQANNRALQIANSNGVSLERIAIDSRYGSNSTEAVNIENSSLTTISQLTLQTSEFQPGLQLFNSSVGQIRNLNLATPRATSLAMTNSSSVGRLQDYVGGEIALYSSSINQIERASIAGLNPYPALLLTRAYPSAPRSHITTIRDSQLSGVIGVKAEEESRVELISQTVINATAVGIYLPSGSIDRIEGCDISVDAIFEAASGIKVENARGASNSLHEVTDSTITVTASQGSGVQIDGNTVHRLSNLTIQMDGARGNAVDLRGNATLNELLTSALIPSGSGQCLSIEPGSRVLVENDNKCAD